MRPARFNALLMGAVIFALAVCAASGSFSADQVTIVGKIYGVAWDEDYNIMSAVIFTEDGKEYLIIDDAKGKELLKLENATVKASGAIGKNAEGTETFTVAGFEVIDKGEFTDEAY